jgi:hypothetical protein
MKSAVDEQGIGCCRDTAPCAHTHLIGKGARLTAQPLSRISHSDRTALLLPTRESYGEFVQIAAEVPPADAAC